MDQLDYRGEVDMEAAAIAMGVGGQERQHRPQALTTVGDDVVAQLVDERDLGIQAQLDEPVDIGEVVGYERAQRVHLRREALGEHAFRIVPSSPGDCHAIGLCGVAGPCLPPGFVELLGGLVVGRLRGLVVKLGEGNTGTKVSGAHRGQLLQRAS